MAKLLIAPLLLLFLSALGALMIGVDPLIYDSGCFPPNPPFLLVHAEALDWITGSALALCLLVIGVMRLQDGR
jgi:hypothetical protein